VWIGFGRWLASVPISIYFELNIDGSFEIVLELRIKILYYTIGYRQNIMDNNKRTYDLLRGSMAA